MPSDTTPQGTAQAPAPSTAPPPPGPTPQQVQAQARAQAQAQARGAVAGWISGLGGAVEDPTTQASPGPGAGQAPAPGAGAAPGGQPEPTSEPGSKGAGQEPTAATGAQPAPLGGAPPAQGQAPAKAEPPGLGEDPDKWPRSAKEWEMLKARRDENYRKRDSRIAELEKALAEREEKLKGYAQAVDPKEHSSVREERDRLSEALRLAAVENHPRFKAYYDGKVGAQVELAKRVVGPEQAQAVEAILKMPDNEWRSARIEELTSGLSPVAAARLGAILNTVDELQQERTQEVARARQDYEQAQARQAQEQAQAQAQSKAQAEALFASTLAKAMDQAQGLVTLQKRTGEGAEVAAWNAAVDQRVQAAKDLLFGQQQPQELVRAALAAVSFPALLEAHQTLQQELAQAQAQITALKAASPTMPRGASTAAPSNGHPAPQPRPQTGSRPMDVARDWIGVLAQEPQP